MPDDVLKDTIEVKLNGHSYEFAIPSFMDEIKIGSRCRDILREATGNINDTVDGIDNYTYNLINTAARFEVLLRRGPEWPWSNGPAGKPIVDFQKWPKDKVIEALSVGVMFSTELSSFRSGGNPDANKPSQEAVESQSDSQVLPIQPGPIAA